MDNSKWVDNEIEEVVQKNKKDFDEQLTFFGDNCKSIDVRQLEMPEPMVQIIKEIETLKRGQALYVDHKKIPQFLLPELEVRNFEILFKEIDCNHTKLLIYKSNRITHFHTFRLIAIDLSICIFKTNNNTIK